MDRQAGILLPITALPSPYGVGTLGKEAYEFVDGLHRAGMKIWQVLPLLPTSYGDSPYQSYSANALNYYFIDFRLLEEDGLLKRAEYESVDFGSNEKRVDYEKLFYHKVPVLKKAFARFDKTSPAWQAFLQKGVYADFALFMSLKEKHGFASWENWEEKYRDYDEGIIEEYKGQVRDEIEFWQFTQYLFIRQWNALKSYANERGISLMGDMPIYLSTDSVEAWKDRKTLFSVDEDGEFSSVAGVPPDAFSEDGQLWGNPLYDWEKMKEDGYAWWKKRIDDAFKFFDIVRIDHFRGFDRYYAVPKTARSAKEGEWRDGPKAALFEERKALPVVAEDLGMIDDGVRELLAETGYPGMKVMLFGFGDTENEHKPSKYNENIVAYTGTHDNEPFCGYLQGIDEEGLAQAKKELFVECERLGVEFSGEDEKELTFLAVELLFASKAKIAIVPYHDVLALGKEARINFPSTLSTDNWSYRYQKQDFSKTVWKRLARLAKKYER